MCHVHREPQRKKQDLTIDLIVQVKAACCSTITQLYFIEFVACYQVICRLKYIKYVRQRKTK